VQNFVRIGAQELVEPNVEETVVGDQEPAAEVGLPVRADDRIGRAVPAGLNQNSREAPDAPAPPLRRGDATHGGAAYCSTDMPPSM